MVNLFLAMIVGAFLTAFLVSHLGPAQFGLISLTIALVSYFGVFSQTISAAINRNLTIAIQSHDRVNAQRIYFNSIAGAGLVILMLITPLALLSLNITSLVNVPAGAEGSSRILSLAISFAFLLSIAALPFQAVSFAENKTYLYALSSILQNMVRLALTVALVLFVAANLASVGVALVASGIASFVFIVLTSLRVAPWLSPTQRTFDWLEIQRLLRLSADIFIMQLGTVAMMSSELVAVNLLFGDYVGGRYAAAVQLAFMLRNVVVSLASLASPVIFANYARGDKELLAKSTIHAMKCIALVVALPTGFLAAAASETLTVWLGSEFSNLGYLLAMQALALALTSVVVPLYSVCLASHKIRLPSIAQLLCAVLFVGSAWLGSRSLSGPLALAGLFLGISVAKELAYMIPYSARCIGIATWRFASPVVYSIILFISCYFFTWLLISLWPAHSWFALICTACAVTGPYLGIAWLTATSEERAETIAIVKGTGVGRWLLANAVSAK